METFDNAAPCFARSPVRANGRANALRGRKRVWYERRYSEMGTTHKLRKPVASRRALQQRQKTLALCVVLALGIAGALALLLIGCGGGSNVPVVAAPLPAVQALQMADIQRDETAKLKCINGD